MFLFGASKGDVILSKVHLFYWKCLGNIVSEVSSEKDICVLTTVLQCKLLLLLSVTFLKKIIDLCADHVISTGPRMTNLVLNFECLFWFFSADIKSRSDSSKNHSYKGALLKRDNFEWIGLLSDLILMKKNQKKHSKFDTKFAIRRPVEMTWSAH